MNDWKPQPYQQAAEELGISNAVLEAAIATGKAVVAIHASLPPIFSLRHLAYLSGVSYKDLRQYVSREIDDPYKIFRIRKRPRRDGSLHFRTICVPEVKLGIVQQWIARNVLIHGRPHSASTAFAPRSRLVEAVQPHCGSRWLIKVDVRKFFESISEISVYRAFRRLGYQPLVSLELTRLCTRVGPNTHLRRTRRWNRRAPLYKAKIRNYAVQKLGHLPQGAPTSPMLANLAMPSVDTELTNIARRYGLIYTRYADDLTFSTRSSTFNRATAIEVISHVYRTLGRFGLEPNLSKTQIVPPRARKVVLGLYAGDRWPRLTREFKNKMRMHLHYLEQENIGPAMHAQNRGFSAVAGLRNHLMGLAAYAIQVEPEYGAQLKKRLSDVPWPIVY